MPNEFVKQIGSRLPELALAILAAKQGGSQALGAFQGGVNQSRIQQQARADELARQAQLDEERRSQAAAVEARAQRDDTRADEAAQQQKIQAAIASLDRYSGSLAETATDPVAAENSILSRASGLENVMGVPQGQLSAFVPNMGPQISKRLQTVAKQTYEQAEKLYGPEAMANDSITITTEAFGPVKPSELRMKFGMQAQMASGVAAKPALPASAVPTPGSFEEFTTATPERKAAIEADRKRYMQADDKGADPVLTEMRQLRLEQQRAGQASTQLPPATQRRVDSKTRAFESLPVVKKTQTMAEAVTFADGLDVNTTNPADDQALIYAFAKAMDPESVVREGEYATVQRYAQSWADNFGFNAARIFSNSPFLTPQARKNMKATIRSRYNAAKGQYENVRREYVGQINRITGSGDGDSYLTDFGAAFPGEPAAPATGKTRIGRFEVEETP